MNNERRIFVIHSCILWHEKVIDAVQRVVGDVLTFYIFTFYSKRRKTTWFSIDGCKVSVHQSVYRVKLSYVILCIHAAKSISVLYNYYKFVLVKMHIHYTVMPLPLTFRNYRVCSKLVFTIFPVVSNDFFLILW